MLVRRDAELTALREVIQDLISEFANLYADTEADAAYNRATSTLAEVYYQHGFKSDGRFRG